MVSKEILEVENNKLKNSRTVCHMKISREITGVV